jgi:putative endonuclease
MSRALSYRKAERSGRFAETGALLLLLCKGYWPLAVRAKTPRGEIDLIVKRGRTLVLVEVKRRNKMETGFHAISAQQQNRIMEAFQWWFSAHPFYADFTIRCDVVLSAPKRLPHHIQNAFQLRG